MWKKFATGFVTGSLILGSVLPIAASTFVEVGSNGSHSNNTVYVKEKCEQKVYQKNYTSAHIDLDLKGNSGKNDANDNVGDVSVDTGNVTNTAWVGVSGGNNNAFVPPCCCEPLRRFGHFVEDGSPLGTGTAVVVHGNGKGSTNDVTVKKYKKSKVKQKTKTWASVDADLNGNSGKNDTNDNTSWGNTVEQKTGHVENSATVEVSGGSNSLGGGLLPVIPE